MAHQAPGSWPEFMRTFEANTKIEGHGLGVVMHSPCPWCAAPDFMVFPVLECTAAFLKGATCKHCGRSMVGCPIEHGFEFVQVGGADAPDWMPPGSKPRRVQLD